MNLVLKICKLWTIWRIRICSLAFKHRDLNRSQWSLRVFSCLTFFPLWFCLITDGFLQADNDFFWIPSSLQELLIPIMKFCIEILKRFRNDENSILNAVQKVQKAVKHAIPVFSDTDMVLADHSRELKDLIEELDRYVCSRCEGLGMQLGPPRGWSSGECLFQIYTQLNLLVIWFV